MRQRIGAGIRAYEAQGFHRTGTAVDQLSAEWLANEVREIGLEPVREEFSLSRVDPIDANLVINGRRIDGLPLFDGGFTDPAGVEGGLGDVDADRGRSGGAHGVPPLKLTNAGSARVGSPAG